MKPLAASLDAGDPAIRGMKAIHLARLAAAGLPVPEGIVIPADIHDDQIAAAVGGVLSWAAAAGAPCGLIIRSSAAAEDGTEASFAGLYTSCFAAARPGDVHAAISAVRRSASSPAVRAYARVRDAAVPSGVAAIVQAAIRPYSAGVLAGQLREGAWDSWQIEAVHGLADPLASGQVTGEIHHLGRERAPAVQADMVLPAFPPELLLPPGEWTTVGDYDGQPARAKIRASGEGLITVLRPPSWKARPILPPRDVLRLLELARAAAAAIGASSVDLEWAISPGGAAHVLQARPLTSPVPNPRDTSRTGKGPGCWLGIPASPGQGTGPSLRLSRHASSAAGTVVVCGNLGPDAAVALLQRPSAIAATTGGPLSHAAIVARELGIPCVTGLPKELANLPDGTTLTVDGVAGTVRASEGTGEPEPGIPTEIDGAAVLTWPGPASAENDGRAGAVILLEPGADPRDVTAGFAGRPKPPGLLQLGHAPLPPLPSRYREHQLPGIGRLAWPVDCGPVPSALVILDGQTPIWQRAISSGDALADL